MDSVVGRNNPKHILRLLNLTKVIVSKNSRIQARPWLEGYIAMQISGRLVWENLEYHCHLVENLLFYQTS